MIYSFNIFRMLDVSTAHLSVQTRDLLAKNAVEGVIYYPKGPWGWFVHVPSINDGMELGEQLPADLKQCIQYAQSLCQDWLLIDADGGVLEDLPTYEDAAEAAEPEIGNLTLLAHSYATYLSKKLGVPLGSRVDADGKIFVAENREGGLYGKVTPAFAHAMVKQDQAQRQQEPELVTAH